MYEYIVDFHESHDKCLKLFKIISEYENFRVCDELLWGGKTLMKITSDSILDKELESLIINVGATVKPMENKTYIKCECGTHLLEITSSFEDKNQIIDLAMFNYGLTGRKHSFLDRLKNAFTYIKTGKMFSDQITLNPYEAKKLEKFLKENIYE